MKSLNDLLLELTEKIKSDDASNFEYLELKQILSNLFIIDDQWMVKNKLVILGQNTFSSKLNIRVPDENSEIYLSFKLDIKLKVDETNLKIENLLIEHIEIDGVYNWHDTESIDSFDIRYFTLDMPEDFETQLCNSLREDCFKQNFIDIISSEIF